jgi:methylmalonyl-CoA decarboxylase
MQFISTEQRGKIGIITFDNPTKMNALSEGLLDEVIPALEDFKTKKCMVIILRAKPDVKVWSAGHDIKELSKPGRDPLFYENALEKTLRAIEAYPGPVIAMVHGSVWGGACDLAMTCDIVIADPTAKFAITPVKIGVAYNTWGVLHFANRLQPNIAKEMFFTADPVSAERALQVGILNHLIPVEQLEAFTMEMAQKITCNAPLSISLIKEQFRTLQNATPISPIDFERLQGLRRTVYDSKDYNEGVTAFLEKRKPSYIGE